MGGCLRRVLAAFQPPVGASALLQIGRNGVVEVVKISVSLRFTGSCGFSWHQTNSRRRQSPSKQIGLDLYKRNQALAGHQLQKSGHDGKVIGLVELRADHAFPIDRPADTRVVPCADNGLLFTQPHPILSGCLQE